MPSYKKQNRNVLFDQPVMIMYHFVIKTAINWKKESSDLINYWLNVVHVRILFRRKLPVLILNIFYLL